MPGCSIAAGGVSRITLPAGAAVIGKVLISEPAGTAATCKNAKLITLVAGHAYTETWEDYEMRRMLYLPIAEPVWTRSHCR